MRRSVVNPDDIVIREARTVATSSTKTGAEISKFRDGGLLISYNRDLANVGYFSADGGKTWREVPWPGDCRCHAGLSDGTVLALSYTEGTQEVGDGLFHYSSWRIAPGCERMEGPFITPVRIPEAKGGTGDDLQSFAGLLFWNSLIEMPDGRLLATMYGYFKGDDVPFKNAQLTAYIASLKASGNPTGVPITSPDTVEGFNKYRTIVVESRDWGASWDYLETVAYDPEIGEEGPCEPSMKLLPNGELLCIMRTGYTHDRMCLCWSSDGGRTWTKPVLTHAYGVDPTLVVMQDGTLACAYGVKGRDGGRRERRLMFSFDGRGETWPVDVVVYAGIGGTYPSVCELGPGELLYAYDAIGFSDPQVEGRPRAYLRTSVVQLPGKAVERPVTPLPVDV